MTDLYTAKFSHEFPAGPSDPAWSYWDIRGPGGVGIGMVRLPQRSTGWDPEREARRICRLLTLAHERGRLEQQAEIRKVLGL